MKNTIKKNRLNSYLQLTGVVFQMGITIYLGAFLGKKLDNYIQPEKKTFTIIFTLLAVIIAMYNIIKRLNKIHRKNE